MLKRIGIFVMNGKKPQNGDTIIEVLVSLAVIALAIGTGYALTNRSFHSGLASAERSQAQAIAQGQVELIKNAYLSSDKTQIDNYKAQENFCIDDGRTSSPGGANSSVGNAKTDGCNSVNGSIYNISITPRTTPASTTFTVIVSWDSATGSGTNQTQLYYKLPGVTIVSPPASGGPSGPPSGGP